MNNLLILIILLVSTSATATRMEIVTEKNLQFLIKEKRENNRLSLTLVSDKEIPDKKNDGKVRIGNVLIAKNLLPEPILKNIKNSDQCEDVIYEGNFTLTLLRCLGFKESVAFRKFTEKAEVVTVNLVSKNPDLVLPVLLDKLKNHNIDSADITVNSKRCNHCLSQAILVSTPFK